MKTSKARTKAKAKAQVAAPPESGLVITGYGEKATACIKAACKGVERTVIPFLASENMVSNSAQIALTAHLLTAAQAIVTKRVEKNLALTSSKWVRTSDLQNFTLSF